MNSAANILAVIIVQCVLTSCAIGQHEGSKKITKEQLAPYISKYSTYKYWKKLLKKYKLKKIEEDVHEFSIKYTGYLHRGEESPDWSNFLWIPIGKPDGKVIMKDKDGNVRREANYKNEKREGRSMWWDEKGEKVYHGFYANNKVVRDTLWFSSGGRVETDSTGLDTTYYANGNKESEGRYNEKRQQTGMWKFWNEDGTLKKEKEFNPE